MVLDIGKETEERTKRRRTELVAQIINQVMSGEGVYSPDAIKPRVAESTISSLETFREYADPESVERALGKLREFLAPTGGQH